MKNKILFFFSLFLIAGCYPDYVQDFDDGAGVYTAYQYDLRTFVLGESESFDFTVALGGIINNSQDRSVKVEIDNSLLTADLSTLVPDKEYASFTAINALLGSGGFGAVCQSYVTSEVAASKIKALTPLPESYYSVSGLDGMTIKAGRHTASATLKATDFIKEDPNVFAPYYAVAFRILSAEDAVTIPTRDFEIIVVKCEHMLYGQWAHEGSTKTLDGSGSGETETYEFSESDDHVYTLSTQDANSLMTDKIGNTKGRLLLTVNADNTVTVSSPDVTVEPIEGESSYFNGARLLQDRKIHLNYKYTQNGTQYEVRDVLSFRSRTRDGVIEYQDENPENYK